MHLIIKIWALPIFSICESSLVSDSSRVIVYDDEIPGYAITEGLIKETNANSPGVCSQMCSKIAQCKSFSFHWSTNICQLTSTDRLSSPGALSTSQTGDYYGMKGDTAPMCANEGVRVDITDDYAPGICAVNEKRADCLWEEWGEWSSWRVDHHQNVIRFKYRTQRGPFHGGIGGCVGITELMDTNYPNPPLERFYVSTPTTWHDAVEFCRTLGPGWHMADPATEEALYEANKFKWGFFWTAWNCLRFTCLTTYDNDENDPHPLTLAKNDLAWRLGEPNMYLSKEFCISGVKEGRDRWTLNDAPCNEHYAFVCEMENE